MSFRSPLDYIGVGHGHFVIVALISHIRLVVPANRPIRSWGIPPSAATQVPSRTASFMLDPTPRRGEQLACWCRPSYKQGDFLTYFVLLEDTQQLVARSNVHAAKDPLFPNYNKRPVPPDGNTSIPVTKPVITTIQDYYEDPIDLLSFSPDELRGMTVLRKIDDDLL